MPIDNEVYAIPRADLAEALSEFNPSQEGFIATDVLPVRNTKLESATVSVVTRENLGRNDAKHSNGAAFNRINMTVEDRDYKCEDYGLEGKLTDKDRALYELDFDAELETTEDVLRAVLIEEEIRAKEAVFNTTTWSGAALFTNNSGNPWSTAATALIAQVSAAKELVRKNTGYVPDTMVIGQATMENMLLNTQILAKFPGAPAITEAMIRANLAAILGLTNLLVGKKIYNSVTDESSFTGADIWPDTYAMVCKVNTGSLRSGGIGRTMLWEKLTPDVITVDSYREPQTESDIFKVKQYVQEKIWDPYFGHLMQIET